MTTAYINFKGVTLRVEGDYTAGRRYSDFDIQPDNAIFEITGGVYIEDTEVTELVEHHWSEIERLCLEELE